MKDVFIYGSDDGIRWLEKGSKTLSTNTHEWSSGVRFSQHPESPRKVYVDASQSEITFTLDKAEATTLLASGSVELEPVGGSNVELRADGGTASAASATRWHSGYVQRK